jgi:hypothetical protein
LSLKLVRQFLTLLETSDCWVVTAGESSVHRHLSTCPNDSHDEQSIRLIRWKIRLCRVEGSGIDRNFIRSVSFQVSRRSSLALTVHRMDSFVSRAERKGPAYLYSIYSLYIYLCIGYMVTGRTCHRNESIIASFWPRPLGGST